MPPSLVHQWCAEAKTLTNDNDMYIFHGPRRNRDPEFLKEQKLVVTTYQIVQREKADSDISCLAQFQWMRIIFDESHCLRNSSTSTYRACMQLNSAHKWICTGTPFVSKVDDIPNQMRMVTRYSIPLRVSDYHGSMKRFLCCLLSFSIRHLTSMQINGRPLLELNRPTHHTLNLDWGTAEERRKYVEEESIVSHNVRNMSTGISLSQVGKLQKRCAIGFSSFINFDRRSSGFLLMTDEEETYVDENVSDCPICMEGIESSDAAIVRSCKHIFCAVCVQTLLQHGSRACPLCRGRLDHRNVCIKPAPEESATEHFLRNASSPKIEKLMSMITGAAVDDKFIIFSNYKDVIYHVKRRLDGEGIESIAYLPGMSLSARQKGLKKFQESPSIKCFILPMRTSSSGLNITAANKIVILEPTLHRNTERQAIGRAWRMGQTRNVDIYHMIMRNTVEEKIFNLNHQSSAEASVDSRWNYNRIVSLFD